MKCFKHRKFGHFAKECRSKIDHAGVSQEKCEKSQAGDLKDNNLSVVREECMMIAQDKETTDNDENSAVIFDSAHLSNTQEFCTDLMEQDLNSNSDKNEDLYSKVLHTVPDYAGNYKESTMMTEQSFWCGNSSSPMLQEDLLIGATHKNSSNNCGIMECLNMCK